jgi:hypothetical protein
MDRQTEDLLDNKSTEELLSVALRELAKASNEIRSGQNDLAKAQSRLRFCVLLANRLKERDYGSKENSSKTTT